MVRRRRKAASSAPAIAGPPAHVPPIYDWQISKEWEYRGKVLTPGVEFRVEGEGLARFRFIRHVERPGGGEWVDCIGDSGFRAFRPERIRKIYKDRKSTEALAAVHKAKVKAKRKEEDAA